MEGRKIMNEFEAGRHFERLNHECDRLQRTNAAICKELGSIQSAVWALERNQAKAENIGLLQKLSRWWNRSHYRALEQQLSEIRTHQMKQDEAVSKLTETQENQAKTIANLVEGNAEINALVAGLKTEIDALKEAANNAEIPENIAALIAGLATSSAEAKDRSQEIADIVKPVEPPPAG